MQFLQGSCHRAGHCDIGESGRTNESPTIDTTVVIITVFPRIVLLFSWFRNENNKASYKSTTASGPGWLIDM